MRILFAGALLALLAACGTKPTNDAPPEAIRAAHFRPAEPAITLITIINNRSGNGAHTALYVEGSQAVLFDPAGSFVHPDIPELGDVLYGMSPLWMQSYKSAHARKEFHVVSQRLEVTAVQAETALKLVQAQGHVSDARCAITTSSLLRQVPGFEGIKTGWYPKALMDQFEAIPGTKTTKLYENDEGDVIDAVQAQLEAKTAQ
ncbi:MAG: hypothetical protein ACSHWZ_02295 [Sulfitobacter sp.]